ncbi:YchF/TatD family DNA exonuclease [Cardiobacteriales bacterium ML27]|uniref:YchF/TatD family DNA exonuclease n=2 Tax=Ostreibacterium oceani TaxID=2654998 RepID=A0A6N7EXY8_9GAMM|nr:YchF/TatD family DNA exonuclease [Ostreibacterium oceani]
MVVEHDKTPLTLETVLANTTNNGVEKMLCVSVSTVDWPAMKQLCEPHADRVKLSAGIHPGYIDDQDFVTLETQLQDEQVIAIGESGLDFYYEHNPDKQQIQRDSFARHIALSRRYQKPLIVHTRDARTATIDVLRSENAQDGGGIMHCFTEDLSMAEAALDLGFYISFSGVITFKNAQSIRDVCAYVPLDRILIETDAPYLAPMPYRGKVNQPAYVRYVAECVAEVKDCTTDEVARITTDNFYRLFPTA